MIKKIAVIGAGVIGKGVAQNLAAADFQVILLDLSQEILLDAKSSMRETMRFQGLINQKFKVSNPDMILSNIIFTTDYTLLEDIDYVIENVVEKWEIKKSVYHRLDQICRDDTVFAVNTSAFSITRIASLTKRADKVVGIHFMNPVPMKCLVEVVKGYHTSKKTLQITIDLLNKMRKEAVILDDWPGFISNRVLMLTINEAICLVQDGVSSPQDIDRVFKGCFEHKMGPLETADMIGLDTVLYSIEVLYESFNDTKYRPSPLLKKMVDAGLLGKKNGQGFYKYE